MKFFYYTLTLSAVSNQVLAHGGTSFPPSRQWLCSGGATPNLNVGWNGQNGPNICKKEYQAINGYDLNHAIVNWSGILQGQANGRMNLADYQNDPRLPHIKIMGGPQAKICSGGNEKYGGLDNPMFTIDQGGYPTDGRFPNVYPTPIQTGKLEMAYTCHAPHRTMPDGYVDTYVTKDGIDLANKVLTWDDLEPEPICRYTPSSYPSGMQETGSDPNNTEKFNCVIPENKLGKHVLFQIWQRSDTPEAFYSCSDVVISKSGQTTDPGQDSSNDNDADDSENSENPTDGNGDTNVQDSDDSNGSDKDSTQEPYPTPVVSPVKYGLVSTAGQIMNGEKCVSRIAGNAMQLKDQDFCSEDKNQKRVAWTTFSRNLIQLKDDSAKALCWKIQDHQKNKLNLPTYPIKLTTCSQNKADSYFKFDRRTGMLHAFMDDRYCVSVDETEILILTTCEGVEYDQVDQHLTWFN